MSQEDYNIINATGAAVRSDINATLSAIVTANSGLLPPETTYQYQIWADTTSTKLKIRDGADDTWIEIGSLDEVNLGLMVASKFPNITGNITSSHTELNKLDGFTGSVTDLNYAKDLRAKGVTATEFDTLDGVTSGIQGQFSTVNTSLNGKAPKNGSTSNLFSVKTPTSSSHASTKSYAEGTKGTYWSKLPNGLIMQWGVTASINGTSVTVTLPVAFTTTTYSVTGSRTEAHSSAQTSHWYTDTYTTTTFVAGAAGSLGGLHWIAIGF